MRYLGGPLDRAASDRKLDRFQHAFDTAVHGRWCIDRLDDERMPIREHERPAVSGCLVDDAVDLGSTTTPQCVMVHSGSRAVVLVGRFRRCFDHDVQVPAPPAHPTGEGLIERVAERCEKPVPRSAGPFVIGHPELDVVDTAPHPRSLPCEEQAQRMAGRVEHDPDPGLVAVGRLMRGFRTARPDRTSNGRVDVVDLDFEVEHLLLFARFLGPDRRNVLLIALNVQTDPTRRVADLKPTGTVVRRDLPTEKRRVELRHRLTIGGVDAHPDPPCLITCLPNRVVLHDHNPDITRHVAHRSDDRFWSSRPCSAPFGSNDAARREIDDRPAADDRAP